MPSTSSCKGLFFWAASCRAACVARNRYKQHAGLHQMERIVPQGLQPDPQPSPVWCVRVETDAWARLSYDTKVMDRIKNSDAINQTSIDRGLVGYVGPGHAVNFQFLEKMISVFSTSADKTPAASGNDTMPSFTSYVPQKNDSSPTYRRRLCGLSLSRENWVRQPAVQGTASTCPSF